jgi:hypothetical protein
MLIYQLNLTQSISIIESAKSIPNLNTRGSPTRYNFPGIYCKVWLETKNNGVSLDAIEYCVLTRLIHLGILWRPSHPKDVWWFFPSAFNTSNTWGVSSTRLIRKVDLLNGLPHQKSHRTVGHPAAGQMYGWTAGHISSSLIWYRWFSRHVP